MAAAHRQPHPAPPAPNPHARAAASLPRVRGSHRPARDRRDPRAHAKTRSRPRNGAARPARQRLRQPPLQRRHPHLRAIRDSRLRALRPLTHAATASPGRLTTPPGCPASEPTSTPHEVSRSSGITNPTETDRDATSSALMLKQGSAPQRPAPSHSCQQQGGGRPLNNGQRASVVARQARSSKHRVSESRSQRASFETPGTIEKQR